MGMVWGGVAQELWICEFVMPVRHLSQDVEWAFGYIRLTCRRAELEI